jgi:intracellular multiplication protein IcmP
MANESGSQSSSSGAGIAIFAVFFLMVVFWFAAGGLISDMILMLRKAQAWPLSFLSEQFAGIVDWIRQAQQTPGRKHNFGALWQLSSDVLRPWAILLALGLFYAAWNVAFNSPITKIRTKHSVHTLRDALARKLPWTNPTAGLDLVNKNPKGWEYQMTPGEFALKHKLLKAYYVHREFDSEKESGEEEVLRVLSMGAWVEGGTFDVNAARKVLTEQLGPRWRGTKHLERHELALFGVFAAQACGDNAKAIAALDAMARSWPTIDYTPGIQLAVEYQGKQAIKRVVGNHYFKRTVLLGLFDAAHNKGKLTTSFFIWLKPVDRILFYALNSMPPPGQLVCGSVEAAGVMSHYFAEKVAAQANAQVRKFNELQMKRHVELGGPEPMSRHEHIINEPYIENAVLALHESLMMTGESRDDDAIAKRTTAVIAREAVTDAFDKDDNSFEHVTPV